MSALEDKITEGEDIYQHTQNASQVRARTEE